MQSLLSLFREYDSYARLTRLLQVLQERVKPAVSEAAAAVGERAARIGGSIKVMLSLISTS